MERLHLKRCVKNYVEQQEALVSDRSEVQLEDDMVIVMIIWVLSVTLCDTIYVSGCIGTYSLEDSDLV